jgi:hypothetical protein
MLVQFPLSRRAHAAEALASGADILKSRARQWAGRILTRVGVPGAIKPMETIDGVTGQKVAVSVGDLFVRLSIDGRDYYFDRLTGRFDGTGLGCS